MSRRKPPRGIYLKLHLQAELTPLVHELARATGWTETTTVNRLIAIGWRHLNGHDCDGSIGAIKLATAEHELKAKHAKELKILRDKLASLVRAGWCANHPDCRSEKSSLPAPPPRE